MLVCCELLALNIVMSSYLTLRIATLYLFCGIHYTHSFHSLSPTTVTCDFSPEKQSVFLRLKFGDVVQILEENGGAVVVYTIALRRHHYSAISC